MHQNIWINSMGGGRREAGAELHSLATKEPPLNGGVILRITPPLRGGSLVAKGAELRSHLPPPSTHTVNPDVLVSFTQVRETG